MLLHNPPSQTIELPKDDICLQIELIENPTTGYRWAIKNIPDGLIEGAHMYTATDKRIPAVPGSGGTRLFEFWCSESVDGILTLSYERSWEKSLGIDVREYHIKF